MKSSYIKTADQTSLYVQDHGEGRPVIFVHSWSMSSDLWQYQTRSLSQKGFRTIAYDARGHGRSEDPGRGFDVDTMVADLAAVVEALDLWDFSLVGHSNGCAQILRYAARQGAGRVSKIGLLGTTTPMFVQTETNPDGVDPAILEATLNRMESDLHGWVDENTDPFLKPNFSPALKNWLWGILWQTSLQAQIESNRAFLLGDFRDDARAIEAPTLLLHGTDDASAPLAITAEKTASLIRNSRLKVYEGASHGLLLTEPARVNQDLYDFLSEVG